MSILRYEKEYSNGKDIIYMLCFCLSNDILDDGMDGKYV